MKNILLLFTLFTIASGAAVAQELNGFVEMGFAPKFSENLLSRNANAQNYAIGEQRVQLKFYHGSDRGELFFKMDFLKDNVLQTNTLDVREAYFTTTPLDWMDLKIGRHIQTWGVGDLMFINDVFPKDWISFFSGRQDEYLKAPSDAVRLSIYPDRAFIKSLELSLMPYAQSDINVMTEGRFGSVNPLYGLVGQLGMAFGSNRATQTKPENAEVAARLQLNDIFGFTTALYGYIGHWNNPYAMDFDMQAGLITPYFAKLNVYGASMRGTALGGVLSLEGGLYDSRDDGNGDEPFIPNSSVRYLALYERSLTTTLDIGIQYYGEKMVDFDKVEANGQRFAQSLAPASSFMAPMDVDMFADELRHLVTLRVTKKIMNEAVWLTWFSYFSPSDQDFYLRPRISWEYSTNIRFALTGNVFDVYGDNDDESNVIYDVIPNYHNTMFGQFKDDSNINFTARYIF